MALVGGQWRPGATKRADENGAARSFGGGFRGSVRRHDLSTRSPLRPRKPDNAPQKRGHESFKVEFLTRLTITPLAAGVCIGEQKAGRVVKTLPNQFG